MDPLMLIIGLFVAIVGHTVSWFGSNSQFMWENWKDNPMYAVILFGLPANILFWMSSRYLFAATNSVWQIRWIMFGASFPAMLVLSKLYFNETFFTMRNIVTLFFAICIIGTQFYFRGK